MGSLHQLEHIKSVSKNITIAYMTISLFLSLCVFVMLASVYRYENINVDYNDNCDEFKFELPKVNW